MLTHGTFDNNVAPPTNTPEMDYLRAIVYPLLSAPDDCRVERSIDERGVLLTLYVHKDDMGHVIGKEGVTATAIRTLLRQYGGTRQSVLSLKIAEPDQ